MGECHRGRRVVPVVEALAAGGARVSIDTRKAVVARAAVAAGATLLNDVGAAQGQLAAELGVAWAAMHTQGEPATMQDDPRYDDVVTEVVADLVARADAAVAAGVSEVWIDPGIGFGKVLEHNVALLRDLGGLARRVRVPLMVGVSRKSFIGHLTGKPAAERVFGTAAAVAAAVLGGAAAVRVHDVAAMRDVVRVAEALVRD